MAASSCFLICLLEAWLNTSSKEPKGTVMDAGRLMALGSLPLKPVQPHQQWSQTINAGCGYTCRVLSVQEGSADQLC